MTWPGRTRTYRAPQAGQDSRPLGGRWFSEESGRIRVDRVLSVSKKFAVQYGFDEAWLIGHLGEMKV